MPSVPTKGLYFALLSKCLLYTIIGMDTKKDQQMKSFSWHMESPTKEGYRCLIMIPTSPLMNIWDLVAWILWRTASEVIVQNWPPKSTQVQLSHLRSNLDSNFTIQAHLELVDRTLWRTALEVTVQNWPQDSR